MVAGHDVYICNWCAEDAMAAVKEMMEGRPIYRVTVRQVFMELWGTDV